MEVPHHSSQPFRFSDPRQQTIYEELKELVGPGPAAFFRDVCRLMDSPNSLESTAHLVGHLLREMESALRGVLKTIRSGDRLSHEEEIRSILRSLGIPEGSETERAWLELARHLHAVAHRCGLEAPRSLQEAQALWEHTQTLMPVLLSGIRERFLDWFPLLDKILLEPTPTKEDVKRLVDDIPNNAVMRHYFFDRLENPEWIQLLLEKGLFRNPPSAEPDEEQGTINFPPWPEMRYLTRMARYKPELVAEIIGQMPDTDNAAVQRDLADALLEMPAETAARLLERAKKWAGSPYLLLPEKLGALFVHLAKGGKSGEAIELARVLLDVLPDSRWEPLPEPKDVDLPRVDPQARFDEWNYRQILRKHFPELVRQAGLPALELVCDLLEKTIRLSRRQENKGETEDYSFIWRPAIEEHAQNLGHTLKDALVSGVRDTAILVIRSDKASVEQVLSVLERRRSKVFQRIALHVLTEFADQTEALVAERLTNRNLFDDVNLLHEYVCLLRDRFSRLSPEKRRIILNWIDAGPDILRFKERQQQRTGFPPSEEEIRCYREIWMRDWLARVGAANLAEEWREQYSRLVKTHGEPEHPEFPTYTEGGRVGPTSPKTADELRGMSVEDIMRFLSTWSPPENLLREPSPEGLGRALSAVVADDPRRFAQEATRFQNLDPTYGGAFLFGLWEALKKNEAFEWTPILELCQWVVGQPRGIRGRHAQDIDADPDWGWTRKAIADLLSAGFEHGPSCIPIELREKVWAILQPLTEDPEPTPEYEELYGGSNMDPATLSLNTTRGEAMHAVVRYGFWVRRHIETQPDREERLCRGFDEMPEVREVLDAHLDLKRESSLAVRSVYGQWFPRFVLLDSDWARDNYARIFPLEDQHRDYLEAAWNTYIAFCQPYDDVLELLRPQYRTAVERISSPKEKQRWLADPDQKLVEHLMAYYWRGTIDPKDPLLKTFWEKAPDKIRGYAIEFIGHALRQTEGPIPKEILQRLQKLWQERFLKAREDPASYEKEILGFGWWFISEKFDPDWSIRQLTEALEIFPQTEPARMVLEQLTNAVKTHPKESVKCLGRIAEGDREGWELAAGRNHIQVILKQALERPEARKEAERVIHYLGSRGFLDFRDLLER
jgi:hypothetical protein